MPRAVKSAAQLGVNYRCLTSPDSAPAHLASVPMSRTSERLRADLSNVKR